MNLIEWAKSQTPKARRMRLIADVREVECTKAYIEQRDFCLRVNTSILETLFKQCPKNHLIVIGRTCGTARPDTFEESVKELTASIKSDERFRIERGSCRVVINPANCKSIAATVHDYYGYFGGSYDVITRWEFVPYPSRWIKDAE